MDKVSETVKQWLQTLNAKLIYTYAKGKYEVRNPRIVDFLSLNRPTKHPKSQVSACYPPWTTIRLSKFLFTVQESQIVLNLVLGWAIMCCDCWALFILHGFPVDFKCCHRKTPLETIA